MGEREPFPPAKLILGVLYAPEYPPETFRPVLAEAFGPIDFWSDAIPFTFTDYYTGEMGSGLSRCFVSFQDLICPSRLWEYKILSNRAEERFPSPGGRGVNLDPGVLTLHSLILATTKNHSHRIPLSDGIYGEITLLYRKGAFHDLPWTYPDYRTEGYKTILSEIRTILCSQLKHSP
ncbi:MAG: DUF4416 family protein [Spirochaetales bacterium]|nr:DUF4416 family protein [Spirochaetales bacterium]